MKLFNKKNVQEEQLKILSEILSILKNEHEDIKKLSWLLISQDNDINKLKEKNRELKNQIKEMENKNDNRRTKKRIGKIRNKND